MIQIYFFVICGGGCRSHKMRIVATSYPCENGLPNLAKSTDHGGGSEIINTNLILVEVYIVP
jgi:hypothetical protein